MKLNKLFFAIAFFLLSQNIFSQTATITQPNGGELLYSCEVYPIQWDQTSGFSNFWNIDYSLDGGTIWASVTSNFLSENGQYLWTVPNVSSNTVLIRIRDSQNLSLLDISDNVFTINFPMELTSPTGGEVW